MHKVTLDFKKKAVLIETEYRQFVEYRELEKEVIQGFVPDSSILDEADSFTFDFDLSTVSSNRNVVFPEENNGVAYIETIRVYQVPGLHMKRNDFLANIGASREIILTAKIFDRIYEDMHGRT